MTKAKIWLMAVRPKTLPAAAAGVVMGGALAWRFAGFRLLPWLAALGVAFLLQIGSNLANDVYDHERGTDTADRKGPVRVTSAGLLTPGEVKAGMAAVLAAAFLLGLYLTFVGGWIILAAGLAAIAAAVLYTGGPFPYGYHGLGDLFVFVFFGPVSVVGTCYVASGAAPAVAWAMSIPVGLIITALLVVNNLRDIAEDEVAGKRTLAVRLGPAATRAEYLVLLSLAYAVPVVLVALGTVSVWTLTVFVTLPAAARANTIVMNSSGAALNKALAATGQLSFLYSAAFAVGLLVK